MLKKSIFHYILISVIVISSQVFAEEEFLGVPILDEHGNETGTYNVNPDPYGEPWVAAPLEFKVALQNYSKSSSRFTSGFSKSTTATSPDDDQGYGDAFSGNSGTFSGEIGLDCSSFWGEFAQNNATGTFFLKSSGSGTIEELYLMIYDNTGTNLLKEIKCDQTNVSIGKTMTIVVENAVDIELIYSKVTPALIKMMKLANTYSIYLPFNNKSEVTVMDTKGRRIASFTAGSKEWYDIPASLHSGVHIVTVRNGNKRYVEKLNCIW